jgi:uncharacterized membrane protein
MHAWLDLALGPMLHQAYCAILNQRASIVGNARSWVRFRRFNDRPVLMPFEIATVAAGKPFRVSSVR